MFKKLAILLFISVYLPVFAAQTTPVFTSHEKPIIVTPGNPTFNITVPSNPSTGYSWKLAGYDKFIFEPVSHKYIAPSNTKLMGAPGYEIWTFKAIYPTTYKFRVNQVGHVRLQYVRPWEKKNAPVTSFVVILKKK